ncbi:AlwI family type II restriction endonuclease [Merdibacter massiliensis]|uniref:AlwI family type II restriction endonuclease n=1 Tax=Merdibacter massiliensis TaxID=1871030 RepID=UPI00096AAE8D|nr:AlwI family type II restriction endonuclease [Merdibacter massiliensis]
MFITIKIDTNTAETFRHGIWYTKDDIKQRLNIVPFTLEQFQKYFVAMFEGNRAKPEHLRDLIMECEIKRDQLNAPEWKQHINTIVSERAYLVRNGVKHIDI